MQENKNKPFFVGAYAIRPLLNPITGTNLTGATVTYGNGAVGTTTPVTTTSIVIPITRTTVASGNAPKYHLQ